MDTYECQNSKNILYFKTEEVVETMVPTMFDHWPLLMNPLSNFYINHMNKYDYLKTHFTIIMSI